VCVCVCVCVCVALPRAPRNLVAEDVGSTSARLRWSAGGDDTIESYTIRWQRRQLPRERHSEVQDIISTQHTLTGLVPYSAYEVAVLAVNNIGPSLPASIVVTTSEDGELYTLFAGKDNMVLNSFAGRFELVVGCTTEFDTCHNTML